MLASLAARCWHRSRLDARIARGSMLASLAARCSHRAAPAAYLFGAGDAGESSVSMQAERSLPSGARALLDFWFAGVGDAPLDPKGPVVARWFTKNAAFDAELRARFADDLDRAARGELGAWCATPRGALAFVLLCDQVARNVHRGTPLAFATDPHALHTTLLALARVDSAHLTIPEWTFLAMPLMHSESLAVHDIARAEFAAIAAYAEANAPGWLPYARGTIDYEERHREVIERFGRYPHRNMILGRTSTGAEVAFLREPGSSF
jgi:uncharacterized protein (DUF924 family)